LADFNRVMAEETENLQLLPEGITAGVAAILADSARGFYLAAESAGEVAGALMVTSEWSDRRNGFFWWIQSVYVRPEFRRHGIERELHGNRRSGERRGWQFFFPTMRPTCASWLFTIGA
jgi:GNAT superfamily N-acetyltransferase